MKSPITTLYYGNPPPFERKPPKPSEGDRLYGEAKAKREALTATLTPSSACSWSPTTPPWIPSPRCGSGHALPRAFVWVCGWEPSAFRRNEAFWGDGGAFVHC